jgi:enoyl-CoA hydratase/carnithine racemase
MTDELLYDQRDGIGHIMFNRPQARNALTFAMYERLAEIATNPGDVRALIITGAGEKAFAAGTDINQFRAFASAPLTMRATREALRRLRDALPPDEDLIRMCYTSQDFKEGMEAFLAKRSPVWRGE